MATATSTYSPSPGARPGTIPGHGPVTRPNMASVGTIIWLSSELMFFAGLFAIYFTIRSVRPDVWAENTAKLDIPFAALNTLILVVSSVWCQLGVFAAEKGRGSRTGKLLTMHPIKEWGMREWYVLTYLFGAVFVAGQVWEYAKLTAEGLTLSQNAYTSCFYITTGFHGIHVTGGLIAFLLIIGRSFTSRRYTHRQATGAIVVSYYWHFVDVVWIALFLTIYFIR